jgi:hypothetical protein
MKQEKMRMGVLEISSFFRGQGSADEGESSLLSVEKFPGQQAIGGGAGSF